MIKKDAINRDDNNPILWPALLIQEHQAELIYLGSEQDWRLQTQSHIDEGSHLLDISGVTYRLSLAHPTESSILQQQDKHLNWRIADKPFRLHQVLALVRQHASVSGHCCTAKLGAESMEQIFEIMKYIEES